VFDLYAVFLKGVNPTFILNERSLTSLTYIGPIEIIGFLRELSYFLPIFYFDGN